mmetsp:Transcript_129103/g.306278  ORF Transcript_129103/g.306278 Transcript_129103/m.306278 type:complete len:113 (-) Transcript_129103:13-351(-)
MRMEARPRRRPAVMPHHLLLQDLQGTREGGPGAILAPATVRKVADGLEEVARTIAMVVGADGSAVATRNGSTCHFPLSHLSRFCCPEALKSMNKLLRTCLNSKCCQLLSLRS